MNQSLSPIGIRVHLTGNQEMGMETESYRCEVWNVESVRHINCELRRKRKKRIYKGKREGKGKEREIRFCIQRGFFQYTFLCGGRKVGAFGQWKYFLVVIMKLEVGGRVR